MSWLLSIMHSRLPSAALLQSLTGVSSGETVTNLRLAIGVIGRFVISFLAFFISSVVPLLPIPFPLLRTIDRGNVASLLLYAAPILTFRGVIQRRTTGEFSCIPYVITLLNCLIYVLYGLPLVSNGWENLPLVTINCVGILLELSFIVTYLWFASSSGRKLVSLILLPGVIAFYIVVVILTIRLNDHHLRKAIVGSIGLVVCIGMYGSPFVVVKKVIQTKSVEFMPFYLSFFSFLTSLLWMLYGLLSWDLLLTAPNMLGCPVGLLQLLLYCIYRKNNGVSEEPYKDLENNGADLESQQPLLIHNDEKN